jgi:hypothetical protein
MTRPMAWRQSDSFSYGSKEYEDLLDSTSPGDFTRPIDTRDLPEPGATLYLTPKSKSGCTVALVSLVVSIAIVAGMAIVRRRG